MFINLGTSHPETYRLVHGITPRSLYYIIDSSSRTVLTYQQYLDETNIYSNC